MLDLTSLLVAQAYAQDAAAGAQETSPMAGMLPFLLIFVIFYFFVIRPQSKRFKEHAALVKALKKGDQVVTGGGIVGKVTKAQEGLETLQVEIAPGVVVDITRASVTGLAPTAAATKEKPAKSKKSADSSKSEQSIANDN